MSAPKTNTNQQQPLQMYRGTVKQITSGDCVVIRSLVVKDGKNLEKQVMLSNITAARLGRSGRDNQVENDMPYAFEAREFLRKKLVGKEVCFTKDTSPQVNVERGTLYLGKDTTGENINDALISAGLVEVRRTNKGGEEESRLIALEDQAKSHNLGKWSKSPESEHVRDVKYTLENPTNFVDSFRQKTVDGIVEYVRDGSTLRVLLLPSYHNVTVQLSGIKCPGFKRENDVDVPEPFAEEAKQFVETRLLQRDVKVMLEGVANQQNGILLGTIHHPNGNMSEFLLREGLAKCVDWSMGRVTGGAEKYRAAERDAKKAQLKLWKNFTPTASTTDENAKTFTGKVTEVLNGDGVVVKLNDGTLKKIFLSSIRPPRVADFPKLIQKADKKNNPLYDVPFLFEAREFLRKKLVGKKVNCIIDYVQPKSEDYPEKVCCTVMLGDTNVSEAIVTAGLAKVIRYKQNDDQRSSKYDDLLVAESRAEKKGSGIHSAKEKEDLVTLKINDINGDANKAKQVLPFLQRAGKIDALVEFVSSGSRFKLYLPKETSLITFLLSGIDCPRLGRPAIGNAPAQKSDEYAEEAFLFSKSHCLQHEVKIEIEGIDKGGNFIGQMITDDGLNLSVGLVEAGFAGVYKASSSAFFNLLSAAEQRAKDKKLNRWKNYVEEKVVAEEAEKNEPQERTVNHKKIVITEVTNDLHFYGQLIENGQKLEQLSTQLRNELESRPPVPGAYTPKAGDLCVAKFSVDNEWYRAKVLSVASSGNATVLFIDYGNREQIQSAKLAQIPAGFETLPPQANEYGLALVQVSSDEDDVENCVDKFKQLVFADGEAAEFTINTEYKLGTVEYVSLVDLNKNDIGKKLVADGYVSVDKARREKRLQKLLAEYLKSLAGAKQAHKMMWRYGDKEQDDAAEFGVAPVKK
jgi:staphylococcal nuclease domain-containing protein 1